MRSNKCQSYYYHDTKVVSDILFHKDMVYKGKFKKTKISVFKLMYNMFASKHNIFRALCDTLIDVPPLVVMNNNIPKNIRQYVEFEGYRLDKEAYIKTRVKIIEHNEKVKEKFNTQPVFDLSDIKDSKWDYGGLYSNDCVLYFKNVENYSITLSRRDEKTNIVGGIVENVKKIDIKFNKFETLKIKNVTFKNSDFFFSWLDNIIFYKCKFENCTIKFGPCRWSKIQNSTFINTNVEFDSIGGFSFNNKCIYDNFVCNIKERYKNGFRCKPPPEQFVKYNRR